MGVDETLDKKNKQQASETKRTAEPTMEATADHKRTTDLWVRIKQAITKAGLEAKEVQGNAHQLIDDLGKKIAERRYRVLVATDATQTTITSRIMLTNSLLLGPGTLSRLFGIDELSSLGHYPVRLPLEHDELYGLRLMERCPMVFGRSSNELIVSYTLSRPDELVPTDEPYPRERPTGLWRRSLSTDDTDGNRASLGAMCCFLENPTVLLPQACHRVVRCIMVQGPWDIPEGTVVVSLPTVKPHDSSPENMRTVRLVKQELAMADGVILGTWAKMRHDHLRPLVDLGLFGRPRGLALIWAYDEHAIALSSDGCGGDDSGGEGGVRERYGRWRALMKAILWFVEHGGAADGAGETLNERQRYLWNVMKNSSAIGCGSLINTSQHHKIFATGMFRLLDGLHSPRMFEMMSGYLVNARLMVDGRVADALTDRWFDPERGGGAIPRSICDAIEKPAAPHNPLGRDGLIDRLPTAEERLGNMYHRAHQRVLYQAKRVLPTLHPWRPAATDEETTTIRLHQEATDRLAEFMRAHLIAEAPVIQEARALTISATLNSLLDEVFERQRDPVALAKRFGTELSRSSQVSKIHALSRLCARPLGTPEIRKRSHGTSAARDRYWTEGLDDVLHDMATDIGDMAKAHHYIRNALPGSPKLPHMVDMSREAEKSLMNHSMTCVSMIFRSCWNRWVMQSAKESLSDTVRTLAEVRQRARHAAKVPKEGTAEHDAVCKRMIDLTVEINESLAVIHASLGPDDEDLCALAQPYLPHWTEFDEQQASRLLDQLVSARSPVPIDAKRWIDEPADPSLYTTVGATAPAMSTAAYQCQALDANAVVPVVMAVSDDTTEWLLERFVQLDGQVHLLVDRGDQASKQRCLGAINRLDRSSVQIHEVDYEDGGRVTRYHRQIAMARRLVAGSEWCWVIGDSVREFWGWRSDMSKQVRFRPRPVLLGVQRELLAAQQEAHRRAVSLVRDNEQDLLLVERCYPPHFRRLNLMHEIITLCQEPRDQPSTHHLHDAAINHERLLDLIDSYTGTVRVLRHEIRPDIGSGCTPDLLERTMGVLNHLTALVRPLSATRCVRLVDRQQQAACYSAFFPDAIRPCRGAAMDTDDAVILLHLREPEGSVKHKHPLRYDLINARWSFVADPKVPTLDITTVPTTLDDPLPAGGTSSVPTSPSSCATAATTTKRPQQDSPPPVRRKRSPEKKARRG